MNRFKRFGIVSLLLSLVVVSCGDPLPIKEMNSARESINRALSVKADKYAPEEIEASKARLIECHDFIVDKEDVEKAKASALESKKLADAAYDKAIPLLAKDTIDIAEQGMEEAVEAHADVLASQEYADARATLDKGVTQYEEKQYYEAYQKAIQADQKAKSARNTALGSKHLLKDEIAEVKMTLRRADNYNASENAAESYNLAQENIATAEGAYNEMKLKRGFAATEAARISAEEAFRTALEKTATEELAMSAEAVEKAGASEGASVAADELAAAKEAYSTAKAMHDEKRYEESIEYSKEAGRLAGIVAMTRPAQEDTSVAQKDEDEDDAEISKAAEELEKAEEKDYTLYTVVYRKGPKDCLWRIAGRHYQNPRKWKKIYQANKDRIKNPDLIYPGWVLKIPKLK